MACGCTCLFERATIAWTDFEASQTMSIPLGFDLDLARASAGSIVVAVYASSVRTGAAARLVVKSIVRGCDADDAQDFVGETVIAAELSAAEAGEAVAAAIPHDAVPTGRAYLEVQQGLTVGPTIGLEFSVWLREAG